MGRPERPLDPAAGPVQAFASQLRDLREAAGRPKYSTLAQRTGRSQTALSEAAGGQRLASWETVAAFVRGCGADPAAWRPRWEAAAATASPDEGTVEPPLQQASAVRRWPALPRRWVAGLLAIVSLAVVVAAAIMAWPEQTPPVVPMPVPTTAPAIVVADGADPMDTRCYQDPEVTVLDSVEIVEKGLPIGRAELRYAPRCGAAWSRFWPFARTQLATGVIVHVDTLRPTDKKRTAYQSRFVGEPVFGNMLLNTGSCVLAAIRIEGVNQDRETRTGCFRGKVLEQP
jgi:hypothetical protein